MVSNELQVRYVCSASALPPSQRPAPHACSALSGNSVPSTGSQLSLSLSPSPALPSYFLFTQGRQLSLTYSLLDLSMPLAPPLGTLPRLPDRGARVPVFAVRFAVAEGHALFCLLPFQCVTLAPWERLGLRSFCLSGLELPKSQGPLSLPNP